jgi:methionyl-tRNA formyltransferase
MKYLYASGDLLETRNTYFYSSYEGRAFLDAWRRQRTDALREMSDNHSTVASAQTPDSQAVRATDILLESIYRQLTAKGGPVGQIPLLDRLVQRFEVSKRLHGEYNEQWRPVDTADYRSLERYVRFAEILDMAYQRLGALPYLNALLKIVDTLTALRSRLNAQQQPRLRRVIAHEQDHVERLSARLRGAVDAA